MRRVGITLGVLLGLGATYMVVTTQVSDMGVTAMSHRRTVSALPVITSWTLNGSAIPPRAQCTNIPIYTESPTSRISLTRDGGAYCTLSSGNLVYVTNDVPRLETLGLLHERALVANNVASPRDCSTASWIRTNTTCTHANSGVDSKPDAGMHICATSDGGSIKQTITAAAATHDTSFYIRRVMGSGAVGATQDGGSGPDISAYLSSTTWQRVQSECGTSGNLIGGQQVIPNCIEEPLRDGLANPQVTITLASAGDCIDVDLVQNEPGGYVTSPTETGRAADIIVDAGIAGLIPAVSQGELSIDLSTEWTSGQTSGQQNFVQTNTDDDLHCGSYIVINPASGAVTGNISKTVSGQSQLSALEPPTVGQVQNYRQSWGSGNQREWLNGDNTIQIDSGVTVMPDCNLNYSVMDHYNNNGSNLVAGWLSRLRWTDGGYASFIGSTKNVYLFGDSIVEGKVPSGTIPISQRPHQAFAGWANAGFQQEFYVHNAGVSANTIQQCQTRWVDRVDKMRAQTTPTTNRLVLQCGINSIGPDDAGVVIGIYRSMVDYATDAGIPVVCSTITPANGVVGIAEFNGYLRDWALDGGECAYADTYSALVDPARPYHLNPAYNSGDDGHPNGAGDSVMTLVWYNVGHDAGFW